MTLFRLDASINPAQSASRAMADMVEAEWHQAHPGDPVIRRHVGTDPLPADAWANAVTGARTPEADRSEPQRAESHAYRIENRPAGWLTAPATPNTLRTRNVHHGTLVWLTAAIARTPFLIVADFSASSPIWKPGQSHR